MFACRQRALVFPRSAPFATSRQQSLKKQGVMLKSATLFAFLFFSLAVSKDK